MLALLQCSALRRPAIPGLQARQCDPERHALLEKGFYCCGMPAASRTAFQRLNSRAMCSPKASALEPRTTTPAVVRRFCTASSLRLSLMVVLSLAMISPGTPRGANTPYHVVTSYPGTMPDSTAARP